MGDFTYIYIYIYFFFPFISLFIYLYNTFTSHLYLDQPHLSSLCFRSVAPHVTLTGHRGLHRGQQALRVPVLGCRLGGAVAGLEDVGGVFW